MVLELIRALFDDSRRGDDRAHTRDGEHPPPPSTRGTGHPEHLLQSGKPPILRRRTITIIVLVGMAAIAYGTVVPFEIDRSQSLDWGLSWHPPTSGDALANIVVYVPIGAFLRLLVRRRGSSRVPECLLSLLVAGGLSYLTEVIQTVLPARVPSWSDVMCDLTGATIGVALAPLLQGGLRNLHAFLYNKLRREPFAAAAAAALACVCAYALAPPDFHPAPGHVTRALERLRASPEPWLWIAGPGTGRLAEGTSGLAGFSREPGGPPPGCSPDPGTGLLAEGRGRLAGGPELDDHGSFTPVQVVDKIVAAGSYGLLAFVLFLAAREAGTSPRASAWRAFSRSVALAAAIETTQLFTISHVADLRDLASAGVCAGLGSVIGWRLVRRWPMLHQRPAVVLRRLVQVVALALLVWAVSPLALKDAPPSPVPISWLPMLDNFHRSWNGLLGDYTTGLLQYTLVAGLLVLWYRSNRRVPCKVPIIGLTLTSAILAGSVAAYRLNGFDTSQLLLAVLAGAIALRLDRAVFGKNAAPPFPAM